MKETFQNPIELSDDIGINAVGMPFGSAWHICLEGHP